MTLKSWVRGVLLQMADGFRKPLRVRALGSIERVLGKAAHQAFPFRFHVGYAGDHRELRQGSSVLAQ